MQQKTPLKPSQNSLEKTVIYKELKSLQSQPYLDFKPKLGPGTKLFKGIHLRPGVNQVEVLVAEPGTSEALIAKCTQEFFKQDVYSGDSLVNCIVTPKLGFRIRDMLDENFQFDVKKACTRLKKHTFDESKEKRAKYEQVGLTSRESLNVICDVFEELIDIPGVCGATIEKVENKTDTSYRAFNCLVKLVGRLNPNNQTMWRYFLVGFKQRRIDPSRFETAMYREEKNERRKKQGKQPKNSLDFQNTLSSKEVEQAQLYAIKTKADDLARLDLAQDSREVYETSAQNYWDKLKTEDQPTYIKLMCKMLKDKKIYSRSHLEFGTGWVIDSIETDIPAGIGLSIDAHLFKLPGRQPIFFIERS